MPQIERVREMFGIPAGGLVRRSGGGQGFPPRVRDLTSVSAIAAAVINRAASYQARFNQMSRGELVRVAVNANAFALNGPACQL